MYPVIYADELKELLNVPGLIIFDARAMPDAATDYQKKHLKGARYISLDKDLADIGQDASQGGRHPLPSAEEFRETVEKFGVQPDSHVVIYDDKNGANAAARLWWMLRSFGLENVQVLSGGLQEAESKGLPMSSGSEEFSPGKWPSEAEWHFPVRSLDEVEKTLQDHSGTVIDVRDAYRYRGESEPIDLVAGHIPGALNIPFSENLDASGNFLPKAALHQKYQSLFKNPDAEIIVHCGSGVTACHTILALVAAGFKVPALYVGSWSEWSRRNKPVAKEI